MKRHSRHPWAVITALSLSVTTIASAQLAPARTCLVENAQVSVSFSGIDVDVSAVRTKLDAKIAEIKGLAGEQQFAKLAIQSSSYNISTNYVGGAAGDRRFQYNGNINFAILPAEKAVDFMQMLANKGYQANVNVNSYNNGACPATGDG